MPTLGRTSVRATAGTSARSSSGPHHLRPHGDLRSRPECAALTAAVRLFQQERALVSLSLERPPHAVLVQRVPWRADQDGVVAGANELLKAGLPWSTGERAVSHVVAALLGDTEIDISEALQRFPREHEDALVEAIRTAIRRPTCRGRKSESRTAVGPS